MAKPRKRLPSGSRIAETSFPMTHLGVSWTGSAAAVRLRTSRGWSDWRPLAGEVVGKDGRTEGGSQKTLISTRGCVGYEIKVADGGSASTVELNTIDGPARTIGTDPVNRLPLPSQVQPLAARQLASSGGPWYLSRGAWGADETLRFAADGTELWPTEYFPVQTLTVHHTVTDNDDPDPAATVRAIYYYDTVTLEWGDLGYHLLIDEAGRVYEGRISGDDLVPVFGSGGGAGSGLQMVNGAHVGGYNAGNIGITVLGDFTSRLPTAAAYTSLTTVLALLSLVCDLDPMGTTDYVNPVSGSTATVATISGHRDWAATECPGNTFYPQLPDLRQDVAALLP